jgi:hypothetical protein
MADRAVLAQVVLDDFDQGAPEIWMAGLPVSHWQ